jgi:hypothetical protein
LPKGVIPPLFDFYLGREEGAVFIECCDALTVTGLLQCRSYAQVLLRGHGSALPDEEVARRVDLRLGRQAVLDRPEDPLRLSESRLGGSYHEEQWEIDEYTEIMNHLRVLALPPEHSADLIRTTRKDLP